MKCDNCLISKQIEMSKAPACCAWYLDNVACGDKTVEDCTEYEEAAHGTD